MRRSTSRARGQSLVEFALALPIILLILFGILEVGRAVYAYNTLYQAARQANRTAIVDQNVTAVEATAEAYAPTLELASVDVCYKDSTTTERDCSSSTDECSPVSAGCLAIVTARANVTPITPIVSAIVPSYSLESTSIGPVEREYP